MHVEGGMGTTYSLPRSPEDYLSNVDEMDIQEDGEHDSNVSFELSHTMSTIRNACITELSTDDP